MVGEKVTRYVLYHIDVSKYNFCFFYSSVNWRRKIGFYDFEFTQISDVVFRGRGNIQMGL